MEFVSGGVIVEGGIGADGQQLADGRALIARPWTPGETVQIVGIDGSAEGVAPASPSCVALFYLGLGDAPNSTIQFSADGSVLIVDNKYGRRLVDSWRGLSVDTVEPAGLISTPGEIPQRCAISVPVKTAVPAPDGYRFAAVEGPIPEGAEVGYRVTIYR